MLSKRLKSLREKAGLTQTQVAEKINLSRVNYNRYENGERFPDSETLIKIASFFNVTIDYLLGKENHKEHKRSISEMGKILEDLGLLDCDMQTFAGILSEIATVIHENPEKLAQWKKDGEYFLSLPSSERKKILSLIPANRTQIKRVKKLKKFTGLKNKES